MNLFEELQWRGLVHSVTDESVIEKLNNGQVTFYLGTDPTGDSLHIGHFSSFLISKRLKDAGHNPILLVGGGTGLIGDPKPDSERPMITYEQVQHNFECLKHQAETIFGFEVVNNYDWLKDISFIDFLRDFGKYFNINYMLNKDIIKRRLDLGITYTEFSYMIMQAMDFLHLFEEKDCVLQGYIDYLSVGDKIVLIDFKSDYVDSDDIFIQRYHSQIEAYKKALTILFSNKDIETYIYSFYLSKMIKL